MTLLLIEQKLVDERFGNAWDARQVLLGTDLPRDHRSGGAFWDHHPMMLYEYFPRVPLRLARRLAAASRAASLFGVLLHQADDPRRASEEFRAACAWLQTFACGQAGTLVPEAADRFRSHRAAAAADRRSRGSPFPSSEPSFRRATRALADLSRIPLLGFARASSPDGDADIAAALGASQRAAQVGFRLHQAVLDWKEEFLAGSYSHVLQRLFVAADCTPAGTVAARRLQIPHLERRFFYGGVAEAMLTAASFRLCESMAAVTHLPSTLWRAMLAQVYERIERLRRDLASTRRSHGVVLRPDAGAGPAGDRGVDPARAAARYLVRSGDADGAWGDFLLSAERSTAWVTAYVGWTLATASGRSARTDRAARWLALNEHPEGGWGYNGNWPRDADTIANVLLFFAAREAEAAERWRRATSALLRAQRRDGGFGTVIDVDPWLEAFPASVEKLDGWTRSHPCVTAVALRALLALDRERFREAITRAASYLREEQRAAGFWEAYWWPGRLYTTCRAAQALRALGDPQDGPRLERAARFVVAGQLADGGWAGTDPAVATAFSTALAILTLATGEPSARAKEAAADGVRWLRGHQGGDGSWPAADLMRHPSPDVERPWERTEWRESILGFDIVIPDWRRLFGTATVLQALTSALAGDLGALAAATAEMSRER